MGLEGWTLVAVLRGNDAATARDGAVSDTFEVWFYRAVLDAETGPAVRSETDEDVIWAPVHSLPSNVLPNLRWLVPMAGQESAHDWPFDITERSSGGE